MIQLLHFVYIISLMIGILFSILVFEGLKNKIVFSNLYAKIAVGLLVIIPITLFFGCIPNYTPEGKYTVLAEITSTSNKIYYENVVVSIWKDDGLRYEPLQINWPNGGYSRLDGDNGLLLGDRVWVTDQNGNEYKVLVKESDLKITYGERLKGYIGIDFIIAIVSIVASGITLWKYWKQSEDEKEAKLIKTTGSFSETVAIENQIIQDDFEVALIKSLDLLQRKQWYEARNCFDILIKRNPENAMVYIGKLMADNCVDNIDDLGELSERLDVDKNYLLAIKYADENLRVKLQEYNLKIVKNLRR